MLAISFRLSSALAIGAIIVLVGMARAENMTVMSRDCSAARSSVQFLAKVANTRDETYHCLGVSVDNRANIRAIRFETHEFDTDRTKRQGVSRSVRVREFTPQEIASADGAVLDGTPGHPAVILQGSIVDGQARETLVIKYLHNGLTNEFRKCPIALDRERNADWRLVNAQNDTVPLVVVKTWMLPLIGTVGIETLQGLCT